MPFSVKDILELLRAVDRLVGLEKRHGDLIEAQAKKLQDLAARVTKLEAREQILVAEAKGAAAFAASAAASQHLADLARCIGALDERTRDLGSNARRRLARPEDD